MNSQATGFTLFNLRSAIFWTVMAATWLASLGIRDLISPDEGRYATLSWFMHASGDWVTPRLNGLLYFEKPVFSYWAGAASFAVFGHSDFAARLWPGLAGLLSVATVAWTAQRLYRAGQVAALLMVACLWVYMNSHFLTVDCGLMFFLTLALCAFLLANKAETSGGRQHAYMVLAWAAMAGAVLSKGLVGLLIPGASLVLYSAVTFDFSPWKRMRWLSGLPVFLLLCTPWFWLVSDRNPGFAHFFFVHEHFERFLTNTHRREGAWWYFIPYLLIGFVPWTLSLPSTLTRGLTAADSGRFNAERFLLVWAGFTFAFFSVSGSKLPSYILPMFPALCLLAAPLFASAGGLHARWSAALLLVAGLLLIPAPLLLSLTSGSGGAANQMPLAQALAGGGAVLAACAAFALRSIRQANIVSGLQALCIGCLTLWVVAQWGHDAGFSRLKSARHMANEVRPLLKDDSEFFAVSYYDQTLPYYLERTVTLVDYSDEFAFGQTAEPQRYLPTLDAFIAHWPHARHPLALTTRPTFEALKQQGVDMTVVYEDSRRLVFRRPDVTRSSTGQPHHD